MSILLQTFRRCNVLYINNKPQLVHQKFRPNTIRKSSCVNKNHVSLTVVSSSSALLDLFFDFLQTADELHSK
jgi:hypothetical protein